jgi:hypothetical protein
METNTIQQEILLITDSGFLQRPLCEIDEPDGHHHLTDKEQLEKACWNGLLQEMLPEIFEKTADGKRLYLWQIRKTSSFFEIELGEFPPVPEKIYSIDPYSFLEVKFYN